MDDTSATVPIRVADQLAAVITAMLDEFEEMARGSAHRDQAAAALADLEAHRSSDANASPS